MAEIEKGTISTFEEPRDRNGDYTKARVLPATKDGDVTRPLTLDWRLRGKMSGLQVGDEVVYVEFEDFTGYIFGRTDGEWDGIVPGDVEVTELATVRDMKSEQVPTYNGHVHPGVASGDTTTEKPQ